MVQHRVGLSAVHVHHATDQRELPVACLQICEGRVRTHEATPGIAIEHADRLFDHHAVQAVIGDGFDHGHVLSCTSSDSERCLDQTSSNLGNADATCVASCDANKYRVICLVDWAVLVTAVVIMFAATKHAAA